ncbi:MAG: hypothetical protein Q7T71_04175 [Herbiconiux sp.]|nr:hypothetical protein [Herbiconiux sp.]
MPGAVRAGGATADAPRGSFTIEARGDFSLAAGIRFLEGFTPAAFEAGAPERLEFAFALEGSWSTVGVSVEQTGATVRARVFARRPLTRAELSAVRAQVARILSLDVDGGGFAAVGEHDAVVAGLQRRHPGLRPVCFWSWYEAAAWAIIGQRVRMTQAAAIKAAMAEQLGAAVTVDGRVLHAFPAPGVLAELAGFPGLTGVKVERLRALGEAARRNVFSSDSLRSMPREVALEALRQLPGVGPFSAELILLRGAGAPDAAPVNEPRLARAVQHAYGLPGTPGPEEVERLSHGWAPYRTWVSLLLRVGAAEAAID